MIPGYEKNPAITHKALKKYDVFVQRLKEAYTKDHPVKSKNIAHGLGLTIAEVGALKQLAWANLVPIGSDVNGYYYCKYSSEFSLIKLKIDAKKNILIRKSKQCHDILIKMVEEEQSKSL